MERHKAVESIQAVIVGRDARRETTRLSETYLDESAAILRGGMRGFQARSETAMQRRADEAAAASVLHAGVSATQTRRCEDVQLAWERETSTPPRDHNASESNPFLDTPLRQRSDSVNPFLDTPSTSWKANPFLFETWSPASQGSESKKSDSVNPFLDDPFESFASPSSGAMAASRERTNTEGLIEIDADAIGVWKKPTPKPPMPPEDHASQGSKSSIRQQQQHKMDATVEADWEVTPGPEANSDSEVAYSSSDGSEMPDWVTEGDTLLVLSTTVGDI